MAGAHYPENLVNTPIGIPTFKVSIDNQTSLNNLIMAPKTAEKKPVVAAKAAKKPVAKKGGKKGSKKGVESWKVRNAVSIVRYLPSPPSVQPLLTCG